MRRAAAVLSALGVLALASPAAAGDAGGRDWGAVVVDVPILRALSIGATGVGCVLFVASLPFTAPFQVVGSAADRLVLEPGRYAFTRPIGKLQIHVPIRSTAAAHERWLETSSDLWHGVIATTTQPPR